MAAEWMTERTAKEALADFAREGIPAAPVRTYPEAARPHNDEIPAEVGIDAEARARLRTSKLI